MDGQVVQAPPEPSNAPVWNVNWTPYGSTDIETHGYQAIYVPGVKHLIMKWRGRLERRGEKTVYVRLVPPPPGSGQ